MAYKPNVWHLKDLQKKEPDMVDPQTGGKLWGIFNLAQTDTIHALYGHVLKANRTGAHTHPDANHYTAIVNGTALVWMEGTMLRLGPGDVVNIPTGVLHDFGADSDEDVWVIDLTTPPFDPAKMQFDDSREEEIKKAFAKEMKK